MAVALQPARSGDANHAGADNGDRLSIHALPTPNISPYC
jgi:hypothetical protein